MHHEVVERADEVEVQRSGPAVVAHDGDDIEPVPAARQGVGDDGEVAGEMRERAS